MVDFTILEKDRPILRVWYGDDFVVHSERLGDWVPEVWRDVYDGRADYKRLSEWIERRVPDREREDMPRILKNYDLKEYMPLAMCRKSHGRGFSDFIWMRFAGEELCYDDVRLR